MFELHRVFRLELIGRFAEKIAFKLLSPDIQREIGRLVVSHELARFRGKGYDLTVSEEALELLVRQGIHKTLGVRPMRRAVQKFIGDAIRKAFLKGMNTSGALETTQTDSALKVESDLSVIY